MLYRPYIQKLYAAINLPIHRYVYRPNPTNAPEAMATNNDSNTHTPMTAAITDTITVTATNTVTTATSGHALTTPAPAKCDCTGDNSNNSDNSAAAKAPATTLVLSEVYEPRGISPQYRQQALDFAQKLHLNLGDKIYMRSTQDLAAILLPDRSLVIIGPIHINKNTSKSKERHTQADVQHAIQDANETATTAIDSTSTATATATANTTTTAVIDSPNTEQNSRQILTAMQRRMVNLWLDMVCQIVMHDVIPPISELQAYAEADRLIPSNLKNITKEVKLNAPHNQYRYELAILDAVAEGDLDKVNRAFLVPKQGKFGVLGPTELRSMQNHVHNLNSLVSRTAIHSGILPEKAYALSDKFFMAAEACTTVEQCIELRTICARSFAALIKEYRQQHLQTLPNLVRNAQLIVSRSLYENCTVASLAQKLQVSPDHLERVFKKNMGIKLSTYIYQEKVKEAQELLLNTNETISDVAQVLGFKAASHFARCFKHFTGMSPREYRNCQTSLNQG